MTASVWSTGTEKCALEFPAVTLVRFLWNHHLLNTIVARPDWLTIPGGSQRYIEAVMRNFPSAKVHLSTPIVSLVNDNSGQVIVQSMVGDQATYDEVILACHGDQAREIITGSATKDEKEIMGHFNTTLNTVYLHSDTSVGFSKMLRCRS